MVTEIWFERRGDHCSAAGKVDQPNTMVPAAPADRKRCLLQLMTVGMAVIGKPPFLSPDRHFVQSLRAWAAMQLLLEKMPD